VVYRWFLIQPFHIHIIHFQVQINLAMSSWFSLPLTFALFFKHCRFFHFVLFCRGAIYEIPRFLKIWRDPKTNSTMNTKDMLRDWTSTHLSNCAWYLDYEGEHSFIKVWNLRKTWVDFFQGLGALEKETPSKKRLEGGKRRGKIQVQESRLET
jgi:hypothetical protein